MDADQGLSETCRRIQAIHERINGLLRRYSRLAGRDEPAPVPCPVPLSPIRRQARASHREPTRRQLEEHRFTPEPPAPLPTYAQATSGFSGWWFVPFDTEEGNQTAGVGRHVPPCTHDNRAANGEPLLAPSTVGSNGPVVVIDPALVSAVTHMGFDLADVVVELYDEARAGRPFAHQTAAGSSERIAAVSHLISAVLERKGSTRGPRVVFPSNPCKQPLRHQP